MMYCYCYCLLAALLSSSVTRAAAFLLVSSVPVTGAVHGAAPSSPPREGGRLPPVLRRPRPRARHGLAAAARGDADAAAPPAVAGVTLKMAFDASPAWGVADLSATRSERFTSPASLDMVHRLRRESAAVLVGRTTVERDDCTLTVRRVDLAEGKGQPVRVILDPALRLLEGDFAILTDGLPTIIYHVQGASTPATVNARSDSVTLVGLPPAGAGLSLSPSDVVLDLAARGLEHIMVEGGPATARAFLAARVVDRAILVRAPVEFAVPEPARMDEATLTRAGLQLVGTAALGGDAVSYWTREGAPWPTAEFLTWP